MIRVGPILTVAILAVAAVRGAEDPPLLKAVAGQQTAEVVKLLESGADPNAAGATGETPLLAASRLGVPDLVRLLISRGAKATTRLPNGETVLHLAEQSGSVDTVKLLLN